MWSCSSSDRLDKVFYDVAKKLGRSLVERHCRLLYGGGKVGMMGAMAREVHAHGGYVIGVIPAALNATEGIAYGVADELIITETMQERKATIYTRAQAFIVLPGGFGTLEECLEVLTLKQLRYHNKAIAIINTEGFFDRLFALFEDFYSRNFAHERYKALYHIAEDPEDALEYVHAYKSIPLGDKWL